MVVDSIHQELYVANDIDMNARDPGVPALRERQRRTDPGSQGPLTTLRGPMGLALDLVHNELIVVSYKVDDEGSITTFSRTASGNVAPTRTIQGR